MSRKQASISLSTAEAEYITAGSCCTQFLWMKKLLCDYGFTQDSMVIHCDNTSVINISKNPIQHSRTKHIDIRGHHFICDLVESREVALMFIPTENQLADILTKPLDGSRFEKSLVFVTCPRHVFDSCSDTTLLFLLVSSVGCMILFK
jgi:hypothetical protein